MLDGSQLFGRALVVLRDCLGLKPSEELLILSDGTVSEELLAASRYAALALGASPLLLGFEPSVRRPVREYGLFAGASLLQPPPSLPRGVLGAMAAADRLLIATSDGGVLYWGAGVREAMRGRPGIRLSYFTTEAALRLLPKSGEEVRALAELTRRAGKILGEARRAHLSSAAGTDLTLSLGQYPVHLGDGVASAGRSQLLPAGQASRLPDDASAEGVLVIDRSIGANDFKELPEPVRMTVRQGKVTELSGGAEAERLRRFLEDTGAPNIYHLTELGIGLNGRCRFTGVMAPYEDTHTRGCVSLALGCDTHFGGKVPAPAHIDMTMRVASLELDGQPIVEKGRLLLEPN